MVLEFTKMHGLGNDFIIIDNLQDKKLDWSKLAKKLCQRNTGIGGDGLVLVSPSDKGDYKMVIYNSDGSLAQMCGNAIRCFGKYLYEKGYTDKTNLVIDTDAGVKQLYLKINEGLVETVKVDMGPPIFQPELIPVNTTNSDNNIKIQVAQQELNITAISMGNPHAVIFVDQVEDFPVKEIGPLIENHPLFPQKTNVEFVQLKEDGTLVMRVWERGVGETQACGTGACAAFVASVLKGKVKNQGEVHLLGGVLKITFDGERVFKEGPAAFVFEGKVKIEEWL
ncbi:diaminopimelate epimerase [Anaerobranca gottschalkii DSM 13577]|uniref:Diaminopimelate epimerase n=2 Tax=Anaerobranca gottschalkii TaxID=108328 RepID=A0A1I0AMX4_9FIRM|nr:diaminopimelate epimerase [Anaerobranca gottschalkii DSM 13577]